MLRNVVEHLTIQAGHFINDIFWYSKLEFIFVTTAQQAHLPSEHIYYLTVLQAGL